MFHLLFFPEFQALIITEIHLNHCKVSPCVFNFFFFSSSFYYRSSSWRLYMIVHQGILFILQLFFKISLKVMIRQAILKIKHGAKYMFCFEEIKYSSSCISKCNSFYLVFWDGDMSFLIISLRVSWFPCCQEWGILNPSISSLELPWVIVHLKPSLRFVAIYGAYKRPKFFVILPEK